MWYHVTSKASLDKILQEGLKPRKSSGASAAYGEDEPSIDRYVYLAGDLDIVEEIRDYLGQNNTIVLSINPSSLNKSLLRPDEDWFKVLLPSEWEELFDSISTHDAKTIDASYVRDFKKEAYGSRGVKWIIETADGRGELIREKIKPSLGTSLYVKDKYIWTRALSPCWRRSLREMETVAYEGEISADKLSLEEDL